MSTRHLFLPFLVALAGFVSCDEFKPEVAVGCVTMDNEYSCALTSAIGGDIRLFVAESFHPHLQGKRRMYACQMAESPDTRARPAG